MFNKIQEIIDKNMITRRTPRNEILGKNVRRKHFNEG